MSEATTGALFSTARTGEKIDPPARYQGTSWLARLGLADGWFLLFRLLGFGHLLKLGRTALAALGALPPALSGVVAYRLLNPGLGLNVFLRDLLLNGP